jgi:hypothetical protein
LEGDSLVVPADVGAEAGDEEWEVDLEAAAAGGDVVACFVDKNGEGEAEAEAPAEERPVDAEEGEEAAQELEAEEQALELEEEGGDGCERAEAFGPAGFFVGGGLGAGVDLGDVIADGLGLGGSQLRAWCQVSRAAPHSWAASCWAAVWASWRRWWV